MTEDKVLHGQGFSCSVWFSSSWIKTKNLHFWNKQLFLGTVLTHLMNRLLVAKLHIHKQVDWDILKKIIIILCIMEGGINSNKTTFRKWVKKSAKYWEIYQGGKIKSSRWMEVH